MDRDVDAVVLDALEASDRLAEDHAGARVLDGEVENLLAGADLIGRENRQRFSERGVDDPPAAAGGEYVSSRHVGAVEDDFGGGDREADEPIDRDAGAVAIDE